MRKNIILLMTVVIALIVSVVLLQAIDARRANAQTQFGDEPLYVNPATARHMAGGRSQSGAAGARSATWKKLRSAPRRPSRGRTRTSSSWKRSRRGT